MGIVLDILNDMSEDQPPVVINQIIEKKVFQCEYCLRIYSDLKDNCIGCGAPLKIIPKIN